jgi:hypothetical protein
METSLFLSWIQTQAIQATDGPFTNRIIMIHTFLTFTVWEGFKWRGWGLDFNSGCYMVRVSFEEMNIPLEL